MIKPTVAILGASANRRKYGNISVRAHLQQGYRVYPVNPRESVIEGLPTYATLADLPESKLDRISVYLPPKLLLPVLDQIATIQFRDLFLNPGTDSLEIMERAKELGLNPIQACSIVELGISPADFSPS